VTVSSTERNINSWKISIPAVGTRLDPITNKAYTVFVIQTQTESMKNFVIILLKNYVCSRNACFQGYVIISAGEDWLVERRPNDFYSLDIKLTEFHGSFRDVQLPPRRLMTSRSECIQVRLSSILLSSSRKTLNTLIPVSITDVRRLLE
jgi:hypothetical protein